MEGEEDVANSSKHLLPVLLHTRLTTPGDENSETGKEMEVVDEITNNSMWPGMEKIRLDTPEDGDKESISETVGMEAVEVGNNSEFLGTGTRPEAFTDQDVEEIAIKETEEDDFTFGASSPAKENRLETPEEDEKEREMRASYQNQGRVICMLEVLTDRWRITVNICCIQEILSF